MNPVEKSYDVPKYNIVRDYNKAQGVTHPSDLSTHILRDYHIRYLSVQNSSTRPIGIAITNYADGPIPAIRFALAGGEIKHIGINSRGGPSQTVWIIDLQTEEPVGTPHTIRSNQNAVILRDGINKWWVDSFYFPSYSAAH